MPRKDTLWEQFLKPIFQTLVDGKEIEELARARDWQKEADRFRNIDLSYPEYYREPNFHGIERGYLNPDAALTYDAVTRYALPPNENWIRESVINAIKGAPRTILDLGCGTGSTTLMLKRAFPEAEVTGIDLSPYMLAIADYKAGMENLQIEWQQANAEKTPFLARSFDVVTASLLFHETPPPVSRTILRECYRLLIPGGQAIILDGHQKILRQAEWLMEIFEEPYIKDYAQDSLEAWMGAADFVKVRTEDVWLVNQLTRGMKPLPVEENIGLTENLAIA